MTFFQKCYLPYFMARVMPTLNPHTVLKWIEGRVAAAAADPNSKSWAFSDVSMQLTPRNRPILFPADLFAKYAVVLDGLFVLTGIPSLEPHDYRALFLCAPEDPTRVAAQAAFYDAMSLTHATATLVCLVPPNDARAARGASASYGGRLIAHAAAPAAPRPPAPFSNPDRRKGQWRKGSKQVVTRPPLPSGLWTGGWRSLCHLLININTYRFFF